MSELRFESAGVLGTGIIAGLFLTVRVQRHATENYERFRGAGQPVMFVFWHGRLLPLVYGHRHEGIVVLVSEHDDGEYLTRVLERHGCGTVRGSSTRGGIQGLKGLVRAARAGKDIAVSPDGPRGPDGIFKPGALLAAQLAGVPVVPIAVRASAGWRLKSWDGFFVPRPFSTVTLEYLEPRMVAREASRADLEALGAEIAADLNAAEGAEAVASDHAELPRQQ